MGKLIVFILGLLFFTAFFLFLILSISFFDFIEFKRSYESTYTSAVCSGNTCQDYLFTCKNGKNTDYLPISGFVVFGDDWVDRRENTNKC